MRLFYRLKSILRPAAALSLLLMAGCGGSSSAPLSQDGQNWPAHSFDGGARAGSYVAVALSDGESVIDPLTGSLELSVEQLGDLQRVSISADDVEARPSAFIHLKYDASRVHPVATRSADPGSSETLFLGVTSEPQVVVLGLVSVGLQPALSGDITLASVDFAPGAQPVVRTSSALDASANTVDDLTLTGEDLNTLDWYYKNIGDYDKNGVVTISDLTPLGANFGASVAPETFDKDSAPFPADGDNNGVLAISDLTPIGANFNDSVTQYVIKTGTASNGPFSPAGQTVTRDSGVGPVGQLRYSVLLTSPIDGNYYVVVPANASEEGPVSNSVQYEDQDPPPPVLNPPTNAQVADNGGQLTVSWQAPLTGETPTGYNLYYAQEGSAFAGGTATLHPSSPIAALSINLSNVEFPLDQDWYFALKSVGSQGESTGFSNIAFWEADQPPTGCVQVTNFVATNMGTHIRLSWNLPAGGSPEQYWLAECQGLGDFDLCNLPFAFIDHPTNSVDLDSGTFPPGTPTFFGIAVNCGAEGSTTTMRIAYNP